MTRAIAVLVFAAALLTPLRAQVGVPVAVNVLTNIERARGTFTSINYQVPDDAVGEVQIRINIPDTAEYEDVRNSLRITAYIQTDEGWHLGPSSVWEGGRYTDKHGVLNPAPRMGFNVFEPLAQHGDLRGRTIRVEVEVWRAMRCGISITTFVPST